ASGRSREKVRNWFNKLDRARNVQDGRELLDKELRRFGLLQASLAPARERFNAASDEDLQAWVALGDAGPHQVGRAMRGHERAQAGPPAPAQDTMPVPPRRKPAVRPSEFTVRGVDNLLVQLARCCQPLPGEAVAGYLTKGRGVSVHREDCTTLARLAEKQPQRRLPVDWGTAAGSHEVEVQLLSLDRKWLLKEVTNAIAQENAHVGAIRSDNLRGGSRVRLRMRLRVADFGQLSGLLAKLSALPGVEDVRRA